MKTQIVSLPERFLALDPGRYALSEAELERVLTPALVVHLDLVRENVARVIALLGSAGRWRPHVKTTKIPVVQAELARAGVRHFKCATTREARVLLATLAAEGIAEPDLLLAHPLVGPALRELARLAQEYPRARISALCEEEERVASIPRALSIFVDVDPGMHRTGVDPEDRGTIGRIARAAGERFRGIHWYDGHLHGPARERRAQAFASYEEVRALLDWLERQGTSAGELVTSGTPTFHAALEFPGFAELGGAAHRVSPGTVVYHDLRSELENPELGLVPAALVLARVVSHPRANVVTADAGSKSIAAEAGDPCAFALGMPELVAQRPSEEHLPLRVAAGPLPARGTPLHLVPRHVCPTVNLAEEALLVERGRVRGSAPVAARAHDLLAR